MNRVFGPVSAEDAETIADHVLCGKHLPEILKEFLRGDMGPVRMAIQIQTLMEDVQRQREMDQEIERKSKGWLYD